MDAKLRRVRWTRGAPPFLRGGTAAASLVVAVLSGGCAMAFGYPDLEAEVCENGTDDDRDGLLDCTDPDCDGACVEADELCFDGRDNDLDGDVDWRDPRCWSAAAQVEIDTCTTIAGGEWLFPPELGRAWVIDGGEVRVDALADGRPVLFGTPDGGAQLSTRAITTGDYREAEVDLELAYLPGGGSVRPARRDPRELAEGGEPEVEYAASVVADGRWEVEVTSFVQETVEVLAPTDAPLLLTLRGRPTPARVEWELSGPAGETLWSSETWSTVVDAPFVLRLGLRGEAGLVSARVARPAWHPCGDDAPRPETALTASDFLGSYTVAGAEPDGSVCMLVMGFGPLHWRRQRRGARTSEMLAVAESDASDISSLYIDEAGGLHALAEVAGRVRRLDASACGQPLVLDPEPVTLTNPRGSQLHPVAFAGGAAGESILFEIQTERGALEHATAIPVEGSRHSFVLGERIVVDHFNGAPTRVGQHWVTPRQDLDDTITMLTLGDERTFASAAASRVPGAWDSSFAGSVVWLPTDSVEAFEGLWIRSARVPDPIRPPYSLAWGILTSRITVRRAP